MITCHLINVLKAFQSPGRIPKLKQKNICTHLEKTHTHKQAHTLLLYDSWCNVTDCHLRMQLGIFFVQIEMQRQIEDACVFYVWESSRELKVGG